MNRRTTIVIAFLAAALSACVSPDTGGAVRAETRPPTLVPLPAAPTSTTSTTTTTTTLGVPAPPDLRGGEVCDLYGGVEELAEIENEEIVEASGIAASRVHEGVFWVINDSGNDSVVYAVATDGSTSATIDITGVLGFDWEDLALGPGPEDGVSYLYVGDIGDNLRLRSTISLLRFPEPALEDGVIEEVDTIRLSFPDGARDSEAMWIDPVTGDAFVVTKRQANGKAIVFRASADLLTPGDPVPLEEVAAFQFEEGVFVTAADVTTDGSVVAFRGYNEVWMWVRTDLAYDETLAAEPCLAPSPDEVQGEALAFIPGELGYVTLSEGSTKPLNLVAPEDK